MVDQSLEEKVGGRVERANMEEVKGLSRTH